MDISVTTPVFGCSANDLVGIARLAEDSNTYAILSPEVPPWSGLSNAHLLSNHTKETKIGTWISNIYLRHSVMCAAEAMTIQEASGNRMLLGLGVSHAPVNAALGVEMNDPIGSMRTYVNEIREHLDGSSKQTRLKRQVEPFPIYIAGLTERTAELAGEVADGLMPYLATPDHLQKLIQAGKKGRESSSLESDLIMTAGLPSFISEDLDLAIASAKKGLTGYCMLPFYQRVLTLGGYGDIVEKIKGGEKPAEVLTDELVTQLGLVGPISQCKEALSKWKDAGVDMAIITPNPVGKQTPIEIMENIVQVID
ncbi:MAG: LLM class flavin-dependent oxidoreductase [Thermodesulfobacteriota bacterium]|nr:LLM class flavin-dependent oxidoreductase [Thermodesulfobacteriota bacterium]MEE2975402.1 LLM class flavin-dependent oxidoreductase [Thermodesulfobacteriota bacterium]